MFSFIQRSISVQYESCLFLLCVIHISVSVLCHSHICFQSSLSFTYLILFSVIHISISVVSLSHICFYSVQYIYFSSVPCLTTESVLCNNCILHYITLNITWLNVKIPTCFFLFCFNLAPPTSQSHVITQLSMPQNLSILQQQGAAQLVTNQVINGQSLVGSHIVTTTLSNSQASSPSITSPTSADSPGGHGTGIKHFLWFLGTCLWMHCCKYLLIFFIIGWDEWILFIVIVFKSFPIN